MRVLLISSGVLPQVSGTELYAVLLRAALERRGHQVDVLALHPNRMGVYVIRDGRYLDVTTLKEAVFLSLQAHYDARYPRWNHYHPLRSRDIHRYVLELALTRFGLDTYDLIHCLDPIAARAVSRVRPQGGPILLTLLGWERSRPKTWQGDERGPLDEAYLSRELVLGCRAADRVFVPFHDWQRRLGTLLHGESGHVEVAPHALPPASVLRAGRVRSRRDRAGRLAGGTRGRRGETRRVLITGPFWDFEEAQLLSEAFAGVKRRWRGRVVGEGLFRRQLAQRLQAQARASRLRSRRYDPRWLRRVCRADVVVTAGPYLAMIAAAAGGQAVVLSRSGRAWLDELPPDLSARIHVLEQPGPEDLADALNRTLSRRPAAPPSAAGLGRPSLVEAAVAYDRR